MSKPLPIDHPLVAAVAKQLIVAIRMDGGLRYTSVNNYQLGPAALHLLAELVGAAHTPERLKNEVQAIYTMLAETPDERVSELQLTIARLSGIIDRGRDALREA